MYNSVLKIDEEPQDTFIDTKGWGKGKKIEVKHYLTILHYLNQLISLLIVLIR